MDRLEAPLFQPRTGRLSFEVLRHRLWQINDEQGQTVINVSGSPVASAGNDFNVAITDAQGLPVMVGIYNVGHLIFCRRCHYRLANATDNPKAGCLQVHEPLSKAGPWVAKRHNGDSPVFHLREYFCPGCGSLLFVDERLKTEPEPWRDYQLT